MTGIRDRGNHETQSSAALAWNKHQKSYVLAITHDIDWHGTSEEAMSKDSKLYTSIELDNGELILNDNIIPASHKFVPTRFVDLKWLRSKPNVILNYNFEEYRDVESVKNTNVQKAIKNRLWLQRKRYEKMAEKWKRKYLVSL